jgi:UDP-hydrolysing UDP-N-acetyl-D-glucosamine 2-epimerase
MPKIKNKRKICFVITSLIHYSRSLLILEELKKRKNIDLHIILGGIALSPKYLSRFTNLKEILENDGFSNIYEAFFNLEGDKVSAKAKTAGFGIIEFASLFSRIKPDLIVVRADRFEVLSAALAAAYMNIPVAHIEGGDLSGTIDESVRHAITKLSHIHFTTNEHSRKRVLRMGENPRYVFNVKSPDLEVVSKLKADKLSVNLTKTGSGTHVDINDKFLMVMYHPVTSELDVLTEKTRVLLEAIHELDLPVLWFWPNFDAGSESISQEIRFFRENQPENKIKFLRYLPPKDFIHLLRKTACLVGNSSAGIKECSYLGIPVVNIGTRQNGRLRANNVLDVQHEKASIKKGVKKQLEAGRYPIADVYQVGDTSGKIAKILAEIKLYTQKRFVDN